jgi:hypothetical protein
MDDEVKFDVSEIINLEMRKINKKDNNINELHTQLHVSLGTD